MTISRGAGTARLGSWPRLALALVLAGAALGTHFVPASGDTQYSGAIEWKTYMSDWVAPFYLSVWGQTRVTSGVTWHYIREELHSQRWAVSWQDNPTKTVSNYASKVYAKSGPFGRLSVRGWSWHKDWYTGDACNTSDGY
jgi:hypothetical protein